MKQNYISIILLFITVMGCSKTVDNKEKKNRIDHVKFEESSENFANPERGFYVFHETTSQNNNVLSLSNLENLREDGISLIYTAYTIPDFSDKAISQSFLNIISQNMEVLREAGHKAIIRFRYTNNQDDLPWDAPEDILFTHITQLKPIFIEYADVIAVLEAGFIGVWGEWYYTENYNFRPTEEDYGPRRKVLDALLDALPKERMILVRYPAAKLHTFGISYTDTISAKTAHNQSNISRVGFHNDCFLADQDDRGTFGGNRNFRKYWEWESKYVPMGGETCSPSSFTECKNALEDMAKYHWSFLNMSYHPGVISDWRTNNCLEEIQKRLGYRLVLTEGIFSNNLNVGDTFEMKVSLKNTGFAAPYNPRNVILVFVSKSNSNEKYSIDLDIDSRFWFGGETFDISSSFPIPMQMKGKNFDVCLHFPDPKEVLKNDPRYSIRLANENVWNSENGYNKIHTITVH